jgi:2-polyprenyl-3-methyl-5-hydroxy-6-metoxy-1,4-benzoquinol methylase
MRFRLISALIVASQLSCGTIDSNRVFGQEKTGTQKQDSNKSGDTAPAKKKKERIPPPRQKYMGRTIAPTMGYEGAPWLIRETREQEENPSVVLKQLGLKPGMVVCDLGCGNGFYSLPIAKAVAPKGKVLAVDIQAEMLQLLSRRSIEEKVENIDMILGTVVDPKLPEGEVDMILLVDVYHEFSNPEQMLAAMRKALKPTGVIALVEFRGEDPTVPILPLHKMTKAQITKEYKANGFKLDSEFDGLPIQHLMFWGVDEEWKADQVDKSSEDQDSP